MAVVSHPCTGLYGFVCFFSCFLLARWQCCRWWGSEQPTSQVPSLCCTCFFRLSSTCHYKAGGICVWALLGESSVWACLQACF